MTPLEQAAYDFVMASRAVESAVSCGVPSSMVLQLEREESDMVDELLMEAEAFFDSVYEGATE